MSAHLFNTPTFPNTQTPQDHRSHHGEDRQRHDVVTNNESHWLTAAEAARYLRVEPRTILIWARQGHVKGYILSGTRRLTWRFLRSDLDATLAVPSVALANRRIQ
jgi:excisionase family DNA binding protein